MRKRFTPNGLYIENPSEIRFVYKILVLSLLAIIALTLFLYIIAISDNRFSPFKNLTPEMTENIIYLSYIFLYIFGIICFLIWTYKTAKNKFYLAHSNVSTLSYIGPKMSVVYYFIPLFCLFKPYRALVQVWESANLSKNSKSRISPKLILVAWISHLCLMFYDNYLGSSDLSNTGLCIYLSAYVSINLLIVYIIMNLSKDQIRAIAQKKNIDL